MSDLKRFTIELNQHEADFLMDVLKYGHDRFGLMAKQRQSEACAVLHDRVLGVIEGSKATPANHVNEGGMSSKINLVTCAVGLIPTKCSREFLGTWYKPWTWFVRVSRFRWNFNHGWKVDAYRVDHVSVATSATPSNPVSDVA